MLFKNYTITQNKKTAQGRLVPIRLCKSCTYFFDKVVDFFGYIFAMA